MLSRRKVHFSFCFLIRANKSVYAAMQVLLCVQLVFAFNYFWVALEPAATAREHYQQAIAASETAMAKLCNSNYEVVDEFENLEALKASIESEPVQTEPEYTLELDSDDYLSGQTFWCNYQGKRIGKIYASIRKPGLFRHSRQRDNSTFNSKEAAASNLVARHRTELATHQRTTALFNPLAS